MLCLWLKALTKNKTKSYSSATGFRTIKSVREIKLKKILKKRKRKGGKKRGRNVVSNYKETQYDQEHVDGTLRQQTKSTYVQ